VVKVRSLCFRIEVLASEFDDYRCSSAIAGKIVEPFEFLREREAELVEA
jgi:hypothetical protein